MPSSADDRRSSLGEEAVVFDCEGQHLVGILHHAGNASRLGVLIVTGGPQYRIGSHRQFLLLARAFADAGFPTLRFDHRGTGDSEGPFLGFEHLETDIEAAVGALLERAPGVERVVLWGLCDAASAILFYAHRDPRVAGIVLLNPWVRTPESEARTYLRHYYLRRLMARDFWRSLLTGRVKPMASAASLLDLLAMRFSRKRASDPAGSASGQLDRRPLLERMASGLARYRGPALLIMSGQDLTAREFEDSARQSASWCRLMAEDRVRRQDLEPADHTFSRRIWRDRVSAWTVDWLRSW